MSDYTELVKALRERALREDEWYEHGGDIIKAAADAIEELQAKVPHWISVKDRLPRSVGNKVIVYLEHEDLNSYIGFGHYEKYHGEESWWNLEREERFDERGYIVTHWMPLPEPPKEEE